MSLFAWTQDMSVGVLEFDAHHQKLISLINKLHDAKSTVSSHSTIEDVLFELANYTVYHFFAEEEAMERLGYKYLEEHKKAHLELTEQTFELIHQWKTNKNIDIQVVINFLIQWLTNHILQTDKKYANLFTQ